MPHKMDLLGISKEKVSLLLIFFILLTAIFTFPLVLGMNSYIPAFHSTDEPYGALWHFWWVKYSHLNNWSASDVNMITVPFGRVIEAGYIYWNFFNKAATLATNPVFSYNLQILLSFLVSCITTYILSFYILRNKLAALFSAIVFSFSPYHSVRSWQHLGLAHIQWMPLYLLALFRLYQEKKFWNILFVALSFTLVMSFDLYYAYFMVIVTGCFLLYLYVFVTKDNFKEKLRFTGRLFLCAPVVLILSAPDLFYIFRHIYRLKASNIASSAFGYIRPFQDLFSQSAKPLSYLLPSTAHPVFGGFTERFIGTQLYGDSFTEHTLYLGWVPLVLAFVAVRRWRRRRKRKDNSGTVPLGMSLCNREDFYMWFFIFLAIVAWFFSQPPWWQLGPIKIYMPSFFMYKILPMFRAYCRFGIVLMLAVAVLAGFGLKFILERFKTNKSRLAITTLFCGLLLFEFWNYPPLKVIDVSKVPAVYYWLREKPGDFVIAEYPQDIDGPNEMYKFYQTTHQKRIINGTIPGTYANKVAQSITKLSDANTAGVLKWMGVKYALVHRDGYLQTDLIADREELNKIPQNKRLKFMRSFPEQVCPQKDIACVQKSGAVDIYEVAARPIEPEVEER